MWGDFDYICSRRRFFTITQKKRALLLKTFRHFLFFFKLNIHTALAVTERTECPSRLLVIWFRERIGGREIVTLRNLSEPVEYEGYFGIIIFPYLFILLLRNKSIKT